MKTVRVALLLACAWLIGLTPALAQAPVTFSTYVTGLTTASSLVGTERIVGLQGGGMVALTPDQILGQMSGDCALASPPSIVCTKTNGVAFAPSATTDTTNAGNISSGVLASVRGGAGTVNGALKANGAGLTSQAACADLSNAAASCATDATNASNIGSGTLNTLRLPSPFTSGTKTGGTSAFVTAAAGTKTSGHVATWDASGNVQDGGAAGSGTVTEQVNTFGYGVSSSGNCNNTGTNSSSPCNAAVSLTSATSSLGANVTMSVTGTFYDGPSISLAAGLWYVSGGVTLTDSAAAEEDCKLWDGNISVIDSGADPIYAAGARIKVALSGTISLGSTTTIRISCKSSSATSVMEFNRTGASKDSTVSAVRIQ